MHDRGFQCGIVWVQDGVNRACTHTSRREALACLRMRRALESFNQLQVAVATLAKCEVSLGKCEATLAERDSTIKDLTEKNKSLDAGIKDLKIKLNTTDSTIKNLITHNEKLAKHIKKLKPVATA
jgi:peptidoglycan hydrolase CwlO-like protein